MASRKLEDLHQKLRPLAQHFLELCKESGLNICLVQTRRTMREQEELYSIGRTKPGKIVTKARPGQSPHNWGMAFDFAFVKNGKITWSGDWEAAGVIAESLGLEWGGRFKGLKDNPHVQLKNWRKEL